MYRYGHNWVRQRNRNRDRTTDRRNGNSFDYKAVVCNKSLAAHLTQNPTSPQTQTESSTKKHPEYWNSKNTCRSSTKRHTLTLKPREHILNLPPKDTLLNLKPLKHMLNLPPKDTLTLKPKEHILNLPPKHRPEYENPPKTYWIFHQKTHPDYWNPKNTCWIGHQKTHPEHWNLKNTHTESQPFKHS